MSHQTKKTVLYFFLMFVCTGLFAQINLNKAKDLVKDKSSNEKSSNEKSAKPEPKAAPATERPAPAAAEPRSSGTEKKLRGCRTRAGHPICGVIRPTQGK
ncbi:MAG: hypothetical protein J0M29_16605 [Chitinophagales bacterium]|nr:hypothetical protein [Chitinophagales bacterium]